MRKKKQIERRAKAANTAAASQAKVAPLPVAIQMGKRLAQMRGKRTIVEFARSIDVHKNTLMRYESGERLPDAWVILQLMEIHKVNPTWLMTGVGEPSSLGAPSAEPSAPPFIPELLAALMQAVDDVLREPALNVVDQKEKVNLALTAYGLVHTATNRDDVGKLAQLRPEELRSAVELILGLQRLGAGRPAGK